VGSYRITTPNATLPPPQSSLCLAMHILASSHNNLQQSPARQSHVQVSKSPSAHLRHVGSSRTPRSPCLQERVPAAALARHCLVPNSTSTTTRSAGVVHPAAPAPTIRSTFVRPCNENRVASWHRISIHRCARSIDVAHCIPGTARVIVAWRTYMRSVGSGRTARPRR
jgi:hypothetical protein